VPFNRAPRHEGVLGSGGIAPRILYLGTRWRWVVNFTPRPLCLQRNSPWHLLDRRLGGPQSRSGRGGEEINSHLLSGLELPIIQLVTRWTIPAPTAGSASYIRVGLALFNGPDWLPSFLSLKDNNANSTCTPKTDNVQWTFLSQVQVCWVVTPCSVVAGYQCFRAACCLHLQGEIIGMGRNGVDIGLDCHPFPVWACIRLDYLPRISSLGLYLCRFLPYRPLHPEDGGSMDLETLVYNEQHYTASQCRRPRLETSLPWKPQNWHLTS
jgi:hypothetical protein